MVLPLTCTVNCEAPMTVARMRWPGSISGKPERRLSSRASVGASGLAMSPNSARLVAEYVFGDAAGEREQRSAQTRAAAAR